MQTNFTIVHNVPVIWGKKLKRRDFKDKVWFKQIVIV